MSKTTRINRHSTRQIKRDISFIKEIKEANDEGDRDAVNTFLDDWQGELEIIIEQRKGKKQP